MFNEWEELFEPHILARGKGYARDKCVKKLSAKDGKIQAIVAGTEYYDVKILYEDDRVVEAYCSCPYAAGGSCCKHMAAVLYAFTENKDIKEGKEYKEEPLVDEKTTDIKELLKDASKIELEQFILELADHDDSISNQIRLKFAKNVTVGDILSLKAEIDNIFYEASGRNGFIDYYHASDFQRCISILIKKVETLVNHGLYMAAFEITKYIFIRTGNQDFDDSGGEITLIVQDCYDILEKDYRKMFG